MAGLASYWGFAQKLNINQTLHERVQIILSFFMLNFWRAKIQAPEPYAASALWRGGTARERWRPERRGRISPPPPSHFHPSSVAFQICWIGLRWGFLISQAGDAIRGPLIPPPAAELLGRGAKSIRKCVLFCYGRVFCLTSEVQDNFFTTRHSRTTTCNALTSVGSDR